MALVKENEKLKNEKKFSSGPSQNDSRNIEDILEKLSEEDEEPKVTISKLKDQNAALQETIHQLQGELMKKNKNPQSARLNQSIAHQRSIAQN